MSPKLKFDDIDRFHVTSYAICLELLESKRIPSIATSIEPTGMDRLVLRGESPDTSIGWAAYQFLNFWGIPTVV